MKSVLVPIADGSEDIETATLIDVLRRAEAQVTVASVMENGRRQITAARGLVITADCHINDVQKQSFDLIALPGGIPGSEHLRDCTVLAKMLKNQAYSGKWYAAICAAPVLVLHHHQLIHGAATAHPAFRDQLPNPSDKLVVCAGNCITSQGAGTTMEFALTLVERLYDPALRQQLAEQMVVIS